MQQGLATKLALLFVPETEMRSAGRVMVEARRVDIGAKSELSRESKVKGFGCALWAHIGIELSSPCGNREDGRAWMNYTVYGGPRQRQCSACAKIAYFKLQPAGGRAFRLSRLTCRRPMPPTYCQVQLG